MEQSSYEALFQSLTELTMENLITREQKIFLKNNIIQNQPEICQLVAKYQEIEELKAHLLLYLKDHSLNVRNQAQQNSGRKQKSLILTTPDQKYIPSNLNNIVSERLEGFLQFLNEKKQQKQNISILEKQKLLKVKKSISELLDQSPLRSPTSSPQNQQRFTELIFRAISTEVHNKYKYIKNSYFKQLHVIQNLMEDGITHNTVINNLKQILKLFCDVDEFSFIAEDNSNNQSIILYNSQTDLLDTISIQNTIESLNKEMDKLEDQKFASLDDVNSDLLNQLLNKDMYDHIEIFKCRLNKKSQILFAFNWKKIEEQQNQQNQQKKDQENPAILYILLKFRITTDYNSETRPSFEEMFKNNKKLIDDIKDQKTITQQIKGNALIPSVSNPEVEMYFRKELRSQKGFFLIQNEFDISDKLSLTHSDSKSIREELRDELKSLTQIDEIDELTPTSRTTMRTNFQKIVNYQESMKMIRVLSKEDPNFKKGQLQMFFPDDMKQEMKGDDQLNNNNGNSSLNQVKMFSKSPMIVARAIHSTRKRKASGGNNGITDKGRIVLPYLKFKPEIFVMHDDDYNLEKLSWNALDLNTTQEKHRTAWAILNREGWIEKYQIPADFFIEFLCELERKYNKRKNPFHNYQHGIAVMQCCYRLSKAKKCNLFLNDLDKFGLTFSGLCHDVAHTGRTNIFEVNSMSKLAIRYHDKSVLEQYHAATSFKILQKEKMNILKNWPHDQILQIRKDIIQNILYTDIKQHFPLLKDFENSIKSMEIELNSPNKEQKDKIGDFGREFQFGKTPDDVNFLRGMIIHSADFTGGVKEFKISRVWSERVNLEFQAQYAEEGKLGIPQTPFFKDLDKIHILAKSEIGFFKFIVLPLWQQMNDFLEKEVDEAVQNVINSMAQWDLVAQENAPKEQQPSEQQQQQQQKPKSAEESKQEPEKDKQSSSNQTDIDQKNQQQQQMTASKETSQVLSKLISEESKENANNLDLNISDVPNFQQDEYDSNGNDIQNDLDCLEEEKDENQDDAIKDGVSSPDFKSSNQNQDQVQCQNVEQQQNQDNPQEQNQEIIQIEQQPEESNEKLVDEQQQ